jgi:hypothetical protein
MKTVRIDGKDYEVGSEAHLDKLEQMRDAAVKVEKDRADALATELASTKTKLDAAEAAAKPDAIAARVAERVSLETFASKVLGAKYKADGKDDIAVMRDIAAKVYAATPAMVEKIDGKKGLGAVKAYLDSMHAAYDAMMKIKDDDPEENDPDAEAEAEAAGPLFGKKKKDARDSADDTISARARAEGNAGTSSRKNRIDHASSHANMRARLQRMSQPKDAD